MCGAGQITLRNKQDTQITFYKVIVASMLRYGSENWAPNRSEGKKTETSEMRCLRRAAGYMFTDHVRSTAIRNTLQIYALEGRIQDYKNR
jgi:hypothetical protein